MESQEVIARRVAAALVPGQVVSLSEGLPQWVPAHVPWELGIVFHSTMGALSNANSSHTKEAPQNTAEDDTSLIPGGALLHEADSFGLLRGGHVNLAVVEALQVFSRGDLAVSPSSSEGPASPGAMVDMVSGAQYVTAIMEHTTPNGASRVVHHCGYPIVGRGCINLVVTELAVIEVTEAGLVLKEVAPGRTVEEVREATEAPLMVASDLKEMVLAPPSGSMVSKVYPNASQAVSDVPDGAVLMIDGFGGVGGIPHYLMVALRDQGARNLTLVSNTAGIARVMSFGTPQGLRPIDHSILVDNGQVKKAVASFPISPSPSRPSSFELAFQRGEVEIELVPQGTLAERIRAGGYGIAAFYTPTGAGTSVAEGKETRIIGGREYVLERAIKADFALIRAHKADTLGNLVYKGTSRNFNAQMATAASVTVAEVDEIVEAGQLDPEAIVTPGAFVQRLVQRPKDFSPYES